jgi:GNAT superfamily N-acetyltransferase
VIEIRPAAAPDAPAISELAAEVQALHAVAHPTIFKPAGAETFPAAVIRERMATAGHCFWVAVVDGEIVGYAYLVTQAEPETAWRYAAVAATLDQMGVAARHRRRGVGAGLVAAVHEAAAALGAAEVRLNVWTFNGDARAFYRRCGFNQVQERLWLPTGVEAGARTRGPNESLQLTNARMVPRRQHE